MFANNKVSWVPRCFFDRVDGCALFMKKKSQSTNSEEHGDGGLLAPTAPIGKVSSSNLYFFEAIISGSVCC